MGLGTPNYNYQLLSVPVAFAAPLTKEDLIAIATSTAQKYKLNESHFLAVIGCESNWDVSATSTTNDFGIAQWNPKYHPDLSMEQIMNPRTAIDLMGQAWRDNHANWWVCWQIKNRQGWDNT